MTGTRRVRSPRARHVSSRPAGVTALLQRNSAGTEPSCSPEVGPVVVGVRPGDAAAFGSTSDSARPVAIDRRWDLNVGFMPLPLSESPKWRNRVASTPITGRTRSSASSDPPANTVSSPWVAGSTEPRTGVSRRPSDPSYTFRTVRPSESETITMPAEAAASPGELTGCAAVSAATFRARSRVRVVTVTLCPALRRRATMRRLRRRTPTTASQGRAPLMRGRR